MKWMNAITTSRFRAAAGTCGVVIAFSVLSVSGGHSEVPASPILTAIDGRSAFSNGNEQNLAFTRTKESGARLARLIVLWEEIAPRGLSTPAGFNPRNPADPAYDWSVVDAMVTAAREDDLEPYLSVYTAPAWASGRRLRAGDGPRNPRPQDIADFFHAAATRYGGSFGGLPRVRYWGVWNEPNLSNYLVPVATSPGWYRAMTNASAIAIRNVRRDNLVIAGEQSPFGHKAGAVPGLEALSPLDFMRRMLCMSAGSNPRPTCGARSSFDIWAHHPYTSGGPTHSAFGPDDVSLGDLPEMRQLLDAAVKAGHVKSAHDVQFWVTEFSWDTSPPDAEGLPLALHARWVSEALYRSWRAGVNLFTWFSLRDEPNKDPYFCQCGLYFRGKTIAQDKPKPALQAFRFPFVAFSQPNATVTFWGRTPASDAKTLVVEQSVPGGWKTMTTVQSNRNGIFQGTYSSSAKTGFVRARIVGGGAGDTARPFGLRVPPDRTFCAFGSC